jgi:hypothetical protein
MRLYSRGQVVFFSILGALITALFILGVGLPVRFMRAGDTVKNQQTD